MNWPQYVYLVIWLLAVIAEASMHGQPRPPYNVWRGLSGGLIALGLLYAGGFFSGGAP